MVGCQYCTHPSIHLLHNAYSLKITVGCPSYTCPASHKNLHSCWTPWSALQKKKQRLRARPPVLSPVPSQAIHSRACLKSHHSDIQGTAQISPCVHTFLRPPQKKRGLSLSGCLGRVVRTWKHECGPGRDNRHARQLRETLRCDAAGIFWEASTRSSTLYEAQCDAPLQAGHRRRGCRSWRHVNQLRLKRCAWHERVVFVV